MSWKTNPAFRAKLTSADDISPVAKVDGGGQYFAKIKVEISAYV
jgi:hypothetical protein